MELLAFEKVLRLFLVSMRKTSKNSTLTSTALLTIREDMYCINNEQGNTTFFTLTVLFVCSVLALSYFSFRITDLKKQKYKQELLLCNKIQNGETKKIVTKLNRSNKILLFLKRAKLTSTALILVVPGYGQIARKSLGLAIKGIQAFQQTTYSLYIQKKYGLKSKYCIPALNNFKGPYKSRMTLLKRNKNGLAQLRRKQWSYSITNKYYKIRSTYSQTVSTLRIKQKLTIRMTRVSQFWNRPLP